VNLEAVEQDLLRIMMDRTADSVKSGKTLSIDFMPKGRRADKSVRDLGIAGVLARIGSASLICRAIWGHAKSDGFRQVDVEVTTNTRV